MLVIGAIIITKKSKGFLFQTEIVTFFLFFLLLVCFF